MNQLVDWLGQQKGYGIMIARICLAAVLIIAGYTKLFVFGFDGFTGFLESKHMFAAPILGYLVPLLEFFGGIAILLGVGSRIVCLWVIFQFTLIAIYVRPVLLGDGWQVLRIDVMVAVLGVLIATAGPGAHALGRKLLPGKRWAD